MRLEDEIDEAKKEIVALKEARCTLEEGRKLLMHNVVTMAADVAGQAQQDRRSLTKVRAENEMLKLEMAELKEKLQAEEAYVEQGSHDMLGERHHLMVVGVGDAGVGGGGIVTDFPTLEDVLTKDLEGHFFDNKLTWPLGSRCRQGGDVSANAPAS